MHRRTSRPAPVLCFHSSCPGPCIALRILSFSYSNHDNHLGFAIAHFILFFFRGAAMLLVVVFITGAWRTLARSVALGCSRCGAGHWARSVQRSSFNTVGSDVVATDSKKMSFFPLILVVFGLGSLVTCCCFAAAAAERHAFVPYCSLRLRTYIVHA